MELQSTPGPSSLPDDDLSAAAPPANMPTSWPIICGSTEPLAAARPETIDPSPDLAPSVCMNDWSTEPNPPAAPPPCPLASESCSSDLAASRNGFSSPSSTSLLSTEDVTAGPARSRASNSAALNGNRIMMVVMTDGGWKSGEMKVSKI